MLFRPDQKNLHGLERKLLVGFGSEPTKADRLSRMKAESRQVNSADQFLVELNRISSSSKVFL
jgi:hypothetical protein